MLKVRGFTADQFLIKTDFSMIYRGKSESDQSAVILKLLRSELPTPQEISLFKHEYNILSQNRIDGVPLAISLEQHGHGYVLILKDSGGSSLDLLYKDTQIDLSTFFDIALPCLKILGRIHSHNLIHCDLKLNNITFNPQTKTVEIIDFGMAIPFSARSGQAPPMAGTLNYMSPEQTGRMNRSLDHRSDLYSLGVTFYELLTGQLPFQGKDILEIVHAHIAVVPKPVHVLRPEVPLALSHIVEKLMAKDAEDRYQSTAGALHDVEICKTQWLTSSKIEDFILGKADESDKFIIPDKVYGREIQVEILKRSLTAAGSGESRFVTIDGPPGIGKSAIVAELAPLVIGSHGVLLNGKYDQQSTNIPFNAFIQGINHYIKETLATSASEVASLRERILGALGASAGVVTAFIPLLESLIGPQDKMETLGAKEAADRLMDAMLRLMRVLGRPNAPLVVFLDDLQWSEAASRTLIKTALTDVSFKHLLLIGVFRGNEVGADHPLRHLLKELELSGVPRTNLVLEPLQIDSVHRLVFDTLKDSGPEAQALASLIYARTGGNAFFVRQFFQSLHDNGLLTFSGRWHWKLSEIDALPATNNVLDILIPKINSLESSTQRLVCAGACVGNEFDFHEVSSLAEVPEAEALIRLKDAVSAGLISQKERSRYRFVHDRIQEAAYSLLNEDLRSQYHLTFGQFLLKDKNNFETEIYRIVHHLNRAERLAITRDDKIHLITLNTKAAQKARQTASFEAVGEYAGYGMALLEKIGLQNDEDLCFPLIMMQSEADFISGNIDKAKQTLASAAERAQKKEHRLEAYVLLANLYNSEMDFHGAYAPSIEALRLIGIKVPRLLKVHAVFKLLVILFRLSLVSDKKLSSLPKAKASHDEEVFGPATLMATTVSPDLYLYLSVTVLERTLKGGYTYCTGPLLVGISAACASVLFLPKLARKLLGPALSYDSNFPGNYFTGWVDLFHGSCVLAWIGTFQEAIFHSEKSIVKMVESGFRTMMTGIAPIFIAGFRTFSGENLLSAASEIERHQKRRNSIGEASFFALEISRSFILCLNGKTEGPLSFSHPGFDVEAGYQKSTSDMDRGWYAMYKIWLCCLIEKPQNMDEYLTSMNTYCRVAAPFSFGLQVFRLYQTLCLADLYSTASRKNKIKFLALMSFNIFKLSRWGKMNPANYSCYADLAKSAWARCRGNYIKERSLLEKVVVSASKAGFPHIEGHANELLGKALLKSGQKSIAYFHLQEAAKLFGHWGASVKVDLIYKNHPELLEMSLQSRTSPHSQHSFLSSASFSSSITPHHSQSQHGRAANFLDVASIMKSSNALAQEIEMDNLIKTLVLTILENAGAQRVVLALEQNSIMHIMAEACGQRQGDTLLTSVPFTEFENLPKGIPNYVLATLEPVVVADATKDPLFQQDPYVTKNQVRSVMCLPVMNKGKVNGFIYLENNASSFVFTPDRVETLKILVSQAAISLENARLFRQAGAKARMEAELETARTVQETLFPDDHAEFNSISIAGHYEPATECGGDLWFYNDLHGKCFVWMGDATGHGAPAALITSSARSAISVMREVTDITPASALRILNNSIHDCSKNRINMTFIVLCIDPQTGLLTYANAAQTAPIYIPKAAVDQLRKMTATDIEKFQFFRKACKFLPSPPSHLLGASIDQSYQTTSFQLSDGDIVVLFSDGITELFNSEKKMFGDRRLIRVLMSAVLNSSEPTVIRDCVQTELRSYRGNEDLADDTTLVVLRYKK